MKIILYFEARIMLWYNNISLEILILHFCAIHMFKFQQPFDLIKFFLKRHGDAGVT